MILVGNEKTESLEAGKHYPLFWLIFNRSKSTVDVRRLKSEQLQLTKVQLSFTMTVFYRPHNHLPYIIIGFMNYFKLAHSKKKKSPNK